MRKPVILLLLLAAGFGSALAARPADVEGWRGARWDMSAAEVAQALGGTSLPGPWEFGAAYAERVVDAEIAGVPFRAFPQLDKASRRLRQVMLEARSPRPGRRDHEQVLAALEERFGPPDRRCDDQIGVDEAVWRFPTTTVHAVFLDFTAAPVFSKDPNAEIDPLHPRADRNRDLPRRLIVRYHPSDRADLMSPACPLE